MGFFEDVQGIRVALEGIEAQAKRMVDAILGLPIGITVKPGQPTERVIMKVKLTKKAPGMKALSPAPKGFKADALTIQDNQDNTFTVVGTDAAGNDADISAVATMTATSDTPATLTVDPPVGVTGTIHTVGPVGTANLTVVVTWNDGSVGPFTVTIPITVVSGGPTGIKVNFGTPTVR